jgi:hypothetical protein
MLFLAAALSSVLLAPTPACESTLTTAAIRRGLLQYVAYNGPAAAESFRAAARRSPHCTAAAFGRVLAEGPNLNFPATREGFSRAAGAMRTAMSLRRYATEPQRRLLAAVALRYAGTFAERVANDRRYAAALRRLANGAGAERDDAALLLAEDLLERDNGPELWSSRNATQRREIAALLRGVLRRQPAAPMAHHLAIHFHDFDPDRTAALSSAAFLASISLDPESEHLAHMSAHAYVRAGRYSDALRASTRALALERRARHPLYRMHDYFVGLGAAFMGNDFARAERFVRAFCSGASCAGTRMLLAVRFARWDRVPAMPADRRNPLMLLLSARALAATGRVSEARARYAELRATAPALAREPNTTAVALAAARRDRRTLEALAAALRPETPGTMPEVLPLFPARELKARALLAAGDAHGARAALRDDLELYPCGVRATAALAKLLPRGSEPTAPAYCRGAARYADGRVPRIQDF